MFYVYMIKSKISEKCLYTGSTANLKERLAAHNKGKVFATRKNRPYFLVYYEAYLDRSDALNRETKLKKYGSSLGHLKNRIKGSLQKKGGVNSR